MFARKVNVYIFGAVIVGLVEIVNAYFIGHYMGPVPLGMISLATAFIQIFFIFSEGGISQAHIKKVSGGSNIDECIGAFLGIKLAIIIILVLIIIGYIYIKKTFFNSSFEYPDQERIIYLMIIPVILSQLLRISTSTFEGKKEAIKATVTSSISPLLKAPVTITVAIMGLGVYGLVTASYISSIGAVIFAAFLLFRKYSIKFPTINLLKSYFSYAANIALVSIMTQLSLQLDRIMVGTFSSTKDLGIYTVALSITAFTNFLPKSVGTLLFPTISNLFAQNKIEEIKKLVFRSEKYLSIILIPITVLFIFFSEELIFFLVGEEFLSAKIPLIILSIYLLIDGTRKPIASSLSATDKIRSLAKVAILSILINISLNVVFIPDKILGIKMLGLGMTGCALATLTSGIFYSIACRVLSRKYSYMSHNKRIFFHYFSGIIMFLFMFLLNTINKINLIQDYKNILLIIAYSAMGLIVYLLCLFIFKEVNKHDAKMVFLAFNPSKMKEYIKSEL